MNNVVEVTALVNPQISIRHRLAGLWIVAMFCYIYADILAFYDDFLLGAILEGNMGYIPITQELKFGIGIGIGIGILMSIPAIMVWVSLAASPRFCRVSNILAAGLFTLISLGTTVMSIYYYYMYFGVLEILTTAYIIWIASRWPVETTG